MILAELQKKHEDIKNLYKMVNYELNLNKKRFNQYLIY